MKKDKNNNLMEEILNDKKILPVPKIGDLVKGKVIAVTKSEVYLDIPGLTGGLVRSRELVDDAGRPRHLKVGEEVMATVIDLENEKGLLELSLRSAGHQQTWHDLAALKDKGEIVAVKVVEANKGGLIVNFGEVSGFMPVSQLSKENYPRVEGGNKSKILEKLRSLVGKELNAKLIDLNEVEKKVIFSEREVYAADKREELKKYKVGDVVEGVVSGLVDFGIFVEFGKGLEGLIHISELAWQRLNHPRDLFKVGDKIKVQIIGIEGTQVTLSAKKLIEDPWKKTAGNYQVGQVVKGKVARFDKFGAFVELAGGIQGLVHISELAEEEVAKPEDVIKVGENYDFKILSIEPAEHRLGLSMKAVPAIHPEQAERAEESPEEEKELNNKVIKE